MLQARGPKSRSQRTYSLQRLEILYLDVSAKTPFPNKVAFISLRVKTDASLLETTIEPTIESWPSPGQKGAGKARIPTEQLFPVDPGCE